VVPEGKIGITPEITTGKILNFAEEIVRK